MISCPKNKKQAKPQAIRQIETIIQKDDLYYLSLYSVMKIFHSHAHLCNDIATQYCISPKLL